ncbi:MAG: type II/IV secretion system protein [Gammaproteobacteria bacterium]|nr:type II/IV secretion system protein [Gammaproteobacteria bacterium]MCP5458033.1 type II/IV secretion system protein [Gammaproteobacteria bacterium]
MAFPNSLSTPLWPSALADQRITLKMLLEYLVTDQLISHQDANRAINFESRRHGRDELHPLVIVANQKIASQQPPHQPLSLETLTQWLADKIGLPYRRIDPLKVDVAAVTKVVSYAYALRYQILPLEIDGERVTFATCEPFLTEWESDLRHLLRLQVQRVIANPLDIKRYLLEFYGLSRSVDGAKNAHDGSQQTRGILNFEQLWELGQTTTLGAEDKPVIQIVDWLLQYAFEQRASDIHLEPRREQGNIRFRIDGVLHHVYQLPPIVMSAVTSRLKILGRMDVAEKRRPQDGRVKTRTPVGREVELRLSTMPTAFGEKCVMRIFDPDIVVKSFSQLGFSPREEETWKDMIRRPHGIVLVTGPTGSGKTTTLYSTLKHLASSEINVCTVEDPIEMVAPEINQMQVQPSLDLSFAQGIRTLLRQDPDIIMVGEIRDLETAQMAVQAALTGHLVLSTLHTNDAPSAITRLLDIGVPHYLIQSTLIGIVAQRLVRTLCPHCKITAAVDEGEWEALIHPWNIRKPAHVGAPKGCPECRHTGFLGRTALYEMLTVTAGLRKLFVADADSAHIRVQACRDGMRTLRVSAAHLVSLGLSTVEEVLQVLPALEV